MRENQKGMINDFVGLDKFDIRTRCASSLLSVASSSLGSRFLYIILQEFLVSLKLLAPAACKCNDTLSKTILDFLR